ncbi:MAG: GMP synthase [bacterium]
MQIGILQTDHVRDEFIAQYGDYSDMFTKLLMAQDPQLELVTYDVQVACPADITCDAYLITGSKASVYDNLPWIDELVAFLRRVLAADKKVIGICFGHQLMAHFFGGRVAPAAQGWAVGVHTSHIDETAPWMGEVTCAQVALLSSHKDQVVALPDGAEVFMSNDFCPVAGFTMGSQVLNIQGHPEFVADYASALMDVRAEVLGDTVYQAGKQSLNRPTQSSEVARWILNFIAGEPA